MTLISNKKHYLIVLFLFFIFLPKTTIAQTFERIEDLAGLGILEENSGVAVADYDGDLDLDIFVVAKAKDQNNIEKTHSRLFRNNNDGSFTDVTDAAGLSNLFPLSAHEDVNPALEGYKYGVSWGDYDSDGFPDLLLTNEYKVQLFRNNGNGTFTDTTSDAGINQTNTCWNTSATWFDFNNDGNLDLYIADWGRCDYNSFYKNNGDGTFSSLTSVFSKSTINAKSFLSVPFDFNSDGWLDLYVSNDIKTKNDLFISHDGVYVTEDAATYGIDNPGDDMGIAIGDYNNDGFFDIFVTNINENVLYKNKGDNTFIDVAEDLGVKDTGWGWDVVFADFDLDGDEDIFTVNGFNITKAQDNFYFENTLSEGTVGFVDKTAEVNVKEATLGVGATPFDYDNDGDLDLFVTNSGQKSFFYSNNTITSNQTDAPSWFKVSLEGTTSNKNAVGTIVSITTNIGVFHRYYTGIGFLSQSILPVHFGLKDATTITELKIKWPSGLVETHQNLNPNTYIKAIEGSGYQVLNVQPSTKIYGCTDPNSCNYNPAATISDNSCTYLTPKTIQGNLATSVYKEESYSYTTDASNTVVWSVENGELISGQGTQTITVKWHFEAAGKITIRETDSNCSSDLIHLNVTINLTDLPENFSVARIWNEALLEAIRKDFARPTVHARNLFHSSIAMYDVWAIYDAIAKPYLIGNTVHNFSTTLEDFTPNESKVVSLKKAMSYAVYKLLTHRFKNSPGADTSLPRFDYIMEQFSYDTTFTDSNYTSGNAAALGNYVAQSIINYGALDGANEANDYVNRFYQPVNSSLNLRATDKATGITNPNRWQPLTFSAFIDQSGNQIRGATPDFLGPEWGSVKPFSLTDGVKSQFSRDGNDYTVYHNPGTPPKLNTNSITDESNLYKWNFSLVSIWSSHLDPANTTMWDISPKSIGNIDTSLFPTTFEGHTSFYTEIEGGDISAGHAVNPKTGSPYETQLVPRADYARVLAEFWADGPDSETPPGHWFTILNYVNDHAQFVRKFNGIGTVLPPLEWDVKAYFILAGAMHDSAITAWGIKGWYDYIRPISAIRYMAELGQSTNEKLENYHEGGIPLKENYIEVVATGDPLSGTNNVHVGKIKVYAWKGHDFIQNSETDIAGVGWILAENWWPYQRPSFVTPPFAGYVSGHSTFSRAAAEVMTLITGDEFFPGGMGEFLAKKNEFLVFEKGPSVDVTLQWATYRDASDQTSLSRIWGGIHPPADDIPGRIIGEKIGIGAYNFALPYFNPSSLHTDDFLLKKFTVYPNPTNQREIFVTNTTQQTSFKLFDQLGKMIQIKDQQFNTKGVTQITLPNSISSGIYLLKVDNRTKLIVVQN